MTQLSDIPEEQDPTHLLLIGTTKIGKSTYAAQAAIDGHTLIYVDSDNGISALRRNLEGHPEAMKRVLYFRTDFPYLFMKNLLEKGIFRWNITQDSEATSYKAKPEDKIVEVIPSRVPRSVILTSDSWTSVALGAMNDGAEKQSVTYDNMGDQSQAVYGDANRKLTLLCAILQHCKFHVIVIAHSGLHELYIRPPGRVGDVKQKDMILKEVTKIPLSCSKNHGLEMGKYFTDVGWLELDRANRRILDFTAEYGRVSGGVVNKKGTVDEMSFSRIFAKPTPIEINESWIRYMTGEEFVARIKESSGAKAGGAPGGTLPKTPANKVVNSMMTKAK